jgi:hypothetical protein
VAGHPGFQHRQAVTWSFYPLVTFLVLAFLALAIDRNEPFKEKLRRKFFM